MDANAKAALAEPFYYALLGTAAGLAVGAVIVLFGRGLEFCVAFGAAGEYHVRCSYATSMAQLSEAIDRIAVFINDAK